MTPAVVTEETVGGPVPRVELNTWRSEYGLIAGITTAGPNGKQDYGLAGHSPVGEVIARWESLPTALSTGFRATVTGRQAHGNTIASYKAEETVGWAIRHSTDGHMTSQIGVLLTVTVADCVPVFLYSPGDRRIGLLHAGWRGVAQGILEEGLRLFVEAGAPADSIRVHLGPAICGSCYEVGPEVRHQLGLPGGDKTVDLRQCLASRASRCGVARVSLSTWCVKHHDGFHSYRKMGQEAGRAVAFLGIPPAGA